MARKKTVDTVPDQPNVWWIRSSESWHIVKPTEDPGVLTFCGLTFGDGVPVDDRTGNEKTCENCFRIAGPR